MSLGNTVGGWVPRGDLVLDAKLMGDDASHAVYE